MNISDQNECQAGLGLPETEWPDPTVGSAPAKARLNEPNREQVKLRPVDLESLLAPDHEVRSVWQFVSRLDLSRFKAEIKAVDGRAGRPATDPRLLLSLWLYAITQGIGSARELARLTTDHIAYQWLCGGVSVNHHSLSDFRVDHESELDQLLTDGVATLVEAKAVTMHRVAQDGMRVRASAGSSSFRRRARLEEHQRQAKEQIEALRKELDGDPQASRQREVKRQLAMSEKRQKAVEHALVEMSRLEKKLAERPKTSHKKKKKKSNSDGDGLAKAKDETNKEPRASTTDPEARVMKMADGGFRPAYNAQFSTDTASQVIVGVEVTNQGTDMGLVMPMIEELERRYGSAPAEALVDGGFASLQDIEQLARRKQPTTIYAPVQKPRNDRSQFSPRKDDSPEIAEWRVRMGTEQAQAIYKQRAATAECVNAIARNRGLTQLLVRGVKKVRSVLLLYAIAHNMMRSFALAAA